jgi:hypothetical protein
MKISKNAFVLLTLTIGAGQISPGAVPSSIPDSDDVVVLSEFKVAAERDRTGYVATESTAGTRVGAKLTETPFFGS